MVAAGCTPESLRAFLSLRGDAPSGLAKPVPRVHWYGPRPCHTPRAASNIKEYFHESH